MGVHGLALTLLVEKRRKAQTAINLHQLEMLKSHPSHGMNADAG